ncbi:FkbM family methyltransferase [Methylorubrum sp. Q1]|uniref:FkbM family methyltransferase n=1 Tax=Methylorubrum sp. Q1 TaxID=2562453 RepID=UPI0010761F62|nr:FkbM family methyltransferase [Methylorubrum sp. Q1]TFZ59950.1 FkbM family methyltransferase [Methylorubrum sp. Q1]
MATEIEKEILETMRLVTKEHKSRTKGTIYPWLDVAHEYLVNGHEFQKAFDRLSDDESRKTFLWMLRYRLSGYLTQSRDTADIVAPFIISERSWNRMGKVAAEMPESSMEGHINVDIIENFVLGGYDLPGICGVESGDVVLDLGAFNGNSTVVLARAAGDAGRVLAFEPNPSTREMLARNMKMLDVSNVEIVGAGVSDTTGIARFTQSGAASRFDPNGSIEVTITTIDRFVEERSLAVDFLKFDIEGFENQALEGAVRTIVRDRPKMAISIYHLHYDGHKILNFINDICPWYEYYVRHNNHGEGEVVLFCKPVVRVSHK